MLTLRMSRSVSIVGAGRLGRSLARRLRRLGWRVGAVVTQSEATSRSAVRLIGSGQPHGSLTREILRSDVILLTVPDGAQQVLLFLAPETGGDFSTLRNAVKGRPGAFVRAAQDLHEASLDRARLDTYLGGVKTVDSADPKVIEAYLGT